MKKNIIWLGVMVSFLFLLSASWWSFATDSSRFLTSNLLSQLLHFFCCERFWFKLDFVMSSSSRLTLSFSASGLLFLWKKRLLRWRLVYLVLYIFSPCKSGISAHSNYEAQNASQDHDFSNLANSCLVFRWMAMDTPQIFPPSSTLKSSMRAKYVQLCQFFSCIRLL